MRCCLQVRLRVAEQLQGLAPLDTACTSQSGSSAQLLDQSADTWRPSTSQAGVLSAEYERVVAQLKKRGEKGHMILALNEVRQYGSACSWRLPQHSQHTVACMQALRSAQGCLWECFDGSVCLLVYWYCMPSTSTCLPLVC